MNMTTRKLALGIALAVLTSPIAVAHAGDYMDGGLKGMRGSYVPVPAPVPVPEYRAKWYLRGDVGLGLNLGMKTKESGMTYGANDFGPGGAVSDAGPFGMGGFGSDTGHQYGHSIGIGAGYYFSKNFRMDLTGELRMEKKNTINGQFQYTDTSDPLNPVQVDGSVRDTTSLQSAIFMANAYYDMNRFGRWKPYIGGGVGFAVNDIRRTHNTSLTQCDPSAIGPPADCDTPTAQPGFNERTERQYTYSLAANLTAGVSYRISDVTSLDLNYRYLYVGGSDVSMAINGNNSKLDIEDQHEHYIRAGLRWDIN